MTIIYILSFFYVKLERKEKKKRGEMNGEGEGGRKREEVRDKGIDRERGKSKKRVNDIEVETIHIIGKQNVGKIASERIWRDAGEPRTK